MRNILVSLIVLLGVYRTNCENTWGCARGSREPNPWLEKRRINSQLPQDRNRNFGAHDDPEGCRPCDCDVGGAIDNSCDPITGQCHCRPNIVGRRCDKPAREYFAHFLDYYKYEGEFAEGSANTRVVIREATAGRERTWTGPGFMRVSEGDSLRFYVDDIPMSMNYDIVVRYEGGMREVWDDVRVTVNRPNQIDFRGPCAGVRPGEDVKSVQIEPGNRHTVVAPSVCLERGVPYQIWLDFNRYRRDRNSPDVSLLIDSIALVPATDSIPIFQGSGVPQHMKQEFTNYRCRANQITVPKGELTDVCSRYIFSIAAIIQEQALPCECDQYGSYNAVCQPMGGQCQCKPHVIGRRCDQCAPGYYQFGPNGCIPEPKDCQDGFYGNPQSAQGCRRCECNEYGWDRRAGNCDKVTGQCPCFPNVIGLRCDRCAPLHWNLQSRAGCQPCNCDPQGSLSQQCDERTGQCQCRPKYGGRTCTNLLECEVNHWGDPRTRCTPCECNPVGVQRQQCDRRTGQCFCLQAFTGDKCYSCASFHGELPDCQPCGECYDSWKRILRDLKNETDWWLREGSKINPIRPGAYDAELRVMEEKLDEVRRLLSEANMTGGGAEQLNWELNQIRQNLTSAAGDLDNVDSELADTSNRIETANNRIESLKRRIEALKRAAERLRQDALNLKEVSLGGALESIKESQRRSREAARRVQSAGGILGESSVKRQQADDLLKRNGDFERTLRQNENDLRDLDNRVDRINAGIVDLNEKVCDGRGDPCDSRCGGGGCGRCGGTSCDQGAATKSSNSIELAERADAVLMEKQQIASQMLRDLRMAQGDTNMAKREAQEAYDKALMLRNLTQGSSDMFTDLIRRMEDFQNQRGARPAEIRAIAEEVLRMSISLTPDQIRDLARQIEELMRNLRNIDQILAATRDDLRRAQRLKLRADDAKADAEKILDLARRVIELLEEAERAQDNAQDAINEALRDITNAQSGLALIETETSAARKTSERSVRRVDNLQDRLDALKKKFLENEINVQKAEREANSAENLADRAESNADTLEVKYIDASTQLSLKYNQTKWARERADVLRIRAARLYQGTYEKIERLRIMESEFFRNERRLVDLSSEIVILNGRMMRYQVDIQFIADYHRTCTI